MYSCGDGERFIDTLDRIDLHSTIVDMSDLDGVTFALGGKGS